jgi:hypothetical protein
MRTTIRLADDLLVQAKKAAAERGMTLTALIDTALRKEVAPTTARRTPIRVPTYGRGGTLPGVDLNDSAGLLELMEGNDFPS